MNSSREDYLQAIYRLSKKKGYTKNKEITNYFGISKASVSEMVKKLQEEGFVCLEHTKISLSKKGDAYAKKLLSDHRLWEYFLCHVLNMPKNTIHEQADLLEHVTGDALREALNVFLGYPTTSPNGNTIYENTNEEKN